MPEPISHSAAVLGTISGAIAFAFDVPAPVIFAAFAGSCFAIALAESTTFITALLMAVGGTVASSYIAPLAHHIMGDYELRGIAAITAFVLIHFKDDVLSGLKELAGAAKDRFKKVIGGVK